MAGGGGGSSSDDEERPTKGGRRGHGQKAAWLPLDIIMTEIAARSDPATLVRCAATCRDARRRVAEDPGGHLRGRLRLRETERFVLPLLRGHLTEITIYAGGEERTDLYMVDTTGAAADATRLVKVKATFADADEKRRSKVVPLDSRGGLVLVRTATATSVQLHGYYAQEQRQLLVCNLATRRRLALPPEPAFPGPDPRYWWSSETGVRHVLLVGGDSDGEGAGAVGRRFQVLKVKLVLSESRSHRRLLVHTFSSEHGAWSSPCTEIPTPRLLGRDTWPPPLLQCRPLVVGGDVHWLCLTDAGSYVLMLHVRQGAAAAAARVSVTDLPASFPRNGHAMYSFYDRYHYLLATATAGGNPVVLVADADRIAAWEQSKHTKMWKPRPQVVIEKKTILGFEDDGLAELVGREGRSTARANHVPELLCFGERSGAVLLRIFDRALLWLDIQSKKIVRCFSSDRRIHGAQVYCAYEMDLSSWVPTFSNAVTL